MTGRLGGNRLEYNMANSAHTKHVREIALPNTPDTHDHDCDHESLYGHNVHSRPAVLRFRSGACGDAAVARAISRRETRLATTRALANDRRARDAHRRHPESCGLDPHDE